MSAKKAVLLCYYFPPNTGVGGRRWLKFCSTLTQEDVEVTVFIPRRFILKNQPSWKDELEKLENIRIIELNDHYPKILLDTPQTVAEKIKYRLSDALIGFFTEGNKSDPSAFWGKLVREKVAPYLEANHVQNLIVSGIPFHYFYDAAQLKAKAPELNLILDFRDLWTDSGSSYGANVKRQQPGRYPFECKAERFSVEQADHILCASDDIADILRRKYPAQHPRMHTVLNGFDAAGLETAAQAAYSGTIRIAYIGTINCARDYYMHLVNGLLQLKKSNPGLYRHLQLDFYGNTNLAFQQDLLAVQPENVTFHGKISPQQVKEVLHAADMVLYIKREDELQNSFASKFFEYLCARRFILLLSPEGKVTEYVRNNRIGTVLRKDAVAAALERVFSDYMNGKLDFNATLDISDFRYDVIAKKVKALLK